MVSGCTKCSYCAANTIYMKVATQAACLRIARWAFRYAVQRGRRKVTVFHKANIMKLTDGMFLRCARQVHEIEFPTFSYDEFIIDAGCMMMILGFYVIRKIITIEL